MTDGAWQSARIVRIAQQTPRIKSFFFEVPRPLAQSPGQHVDVRLTAPDGYQAMRSYSIASSPDADGVFELAIDRLDNGEVSTFFHDVAAVGDDIDVRGPLGGHFIWRPADGGAVLLIAGGSGVVPFMAMIRTWDDVGSTVPVGLLMSASTADEVLYRTQLSAIATAKPAFRFRLSLTREPSGQDADYHRRLDAPMIADMLILLEQPPSKTFICGSNSFVNTATDALEAAGVDAKIIRTERYGG